MSAQRAVLLLTLYLLLTANWPLWLSLARIAQGQGDVLSLGVPMLGLLASATLAVLGVTAWSRGMRWLWWLLLLVAALAQYYMLTYRVVMDPGMLTNVMQTDVRETRDLLTARLLTSVLLVMTLPTWWLLHLQLLPAPWWRQMARNAGLIALALALAGATIALGSRSLAPLMRNHTELRYLMNPAAPLFSSVMAVHDQWFSRPRTLVKMTAGAALGASHAGNRRPLLLALVVGETARADHFALNGYARATNPELARRDDVLSWRDVFSCGTSTAASLPCMFSPLGRDGFLARSEDTENLLDVVQAAGLAVLWLDNQSGCKGVCDRVHHADAIDGLSPQQRQQLCPGGECSDEAMLAGLDARIAALPEAERARGVLLVLHQMGSHGPAYYKRSTAAQKTFEPECRTEVLSDCDQQALINAYDNSIVATDAFLAGTVDWLAQRSAQSDTGLLYVSDHGESLGEYGLYLHGMPYAVAPDVQKHVPMLAWFSAPLQQRLGLSPVCLRTHLDAPLTHDNLYSSVLTLLDVRSPSYNRALDLFAACRRE
ncbi:MAG: phosphoethanolamine transferase [Comamonas sp. SCN 65-56]|uniref:phosphoethanolamine transferase n=1 Tax=Comamonas sp. SCN 65-56 TaxID=1660095 RepID=UPI000868F665|nr:phosphoethanolamine--lipid A transferase [Comamonas sp. SCN 65-56]ODS92071.1 MAG: phosphoethanolamine transferase [Comamonas sp. SCN 65-56]